MHKLLSNIRRNTPLVHCITNFVTANDCANLLLACGARPVMADAPEEAAEITAHSQALVFNLGTLSQSRLEAMLRAGAFANRNDIPVVLDPVGVGASEFRCAAVRKLLREIHFTAIRGNVNEIRSTFILASGSRCVPTDDPPADLFFARKLAKRIDVSVISTGAEDIVTDGEKTFRITNGHPIQKQITGAGCMLSALTGAFLAAEVSLESCAAAVCTMGLAGEIAVSRMKKLDGNASCRNYMIDAVYNMTDEQLEEGAKLEHLT